MRAELRQHLDEVFEEHPAPPLTPEQERVLLPLFKDVRPRSEKERMAS